ncbi:Glycosyl transferase family 2 [Pedobacter westerhofensis]|uniref:Glycosyl transferase family 2 n=1 Tax=Pedobacter westerhofensis TaxID=425512 RepID=A0A521FTL5_9SPHI|nr:glycosyltransferase family A protein [Pedobacter westerhofensis]SMO98861.1 Glycosyl transferase family 2 [Pedobacter westerhofensis]
MEQPLVSCIMPTADRHQFIPYAIDYFLHQNYPNTELIILDTGKTSCADLVPVDSRIRYQYTNTLMALGDKRNLCCGEARGHIIVHWDDDDWYAEDWIANQVKALVSHPGVEITGLRNIDFFSALTNERWEFNDTDDDNPWVYGATLAYWKSFWEQNPFRIMNAGEDLHFVKSPGAVIYPHRYVKGYLGIIHEQNKSIRLYENPKEKLEQSKWVAMIEGPQIYHDKEKIIYPVNAPLVSCIMPTANRQDFIPAAIQNFQKQDYPNIELIIIDDGVKSIRRLIPDDPRIKYYYSGSAKSVGEKRNIACSKASGEYIVHWDDDDWYAGDWISHQVNALTESGADISGINQVQFFSPSSNKYWMTHNYNSKSPWLTGATLIYRRSYWQQHPFKDLQVGEDNEYVRSNGARIFAHDYFQGFIATSHQDNTNVKFMNMPK